MPRNRRLIFATEKVELWNHHQLDSAGAANAADLQRISRRISRACC